MQSRLDSAKKKLFTSNSNNDRKDYQRAYYLANKNDNFNNRDSDNGLPADAMLWDSCKNMYCFDSYESMDDFEESATDFLREQVDKVNEKSIPLVIRFLLLIIFVLRQIFTYRVGTGTPYLLSNAIMFARHVLSALLFVQDKDYVPSETDLKNAKSMYEQLKNDFSAEKIISFSCILVKVTL